jgi:putative transposase
MSAPRQILPGRTYLITRRCIQRQFLLTPSKTLNQVFLFCLAYAAETFGMEVHAFACLSNHAHLVVTDPGGRLPQFMHWLSLYVAKCMNTYYGRWGAFWEPESYSSVEVIEDDDVLDKLIYTLANPVASGLVRWGEEWPGLRSRPEEIGTREFVAKRPDFFFSPTSSIPKKVKLRLTKPKQFSTLTDEAFRALLTERYKDTEREIHEEFKRENRGFLGPQRIKKQSPSDSAKSYEEKRTLNPRLAAKRKWPRIAAIERLTEFLKAYREAMSEYFAGDDSVIFPAGTYWMRVRFGVLCHAPP